MSAEAVLTELAPKPQNFEVGTVVAEIPVAAWELDLPPELSPVQIVRADIHDPNIEYLEAIRPGRVRALQDQEQEMNDFSRGRFSFWRHHERGVPYDQADSRLDSDESTASGDPVSRDRYFNDPNFLGDDALRAWRSTVPTAIALAPLANPFNTSKVEDNHGQLHDMTEYAQEWMTACTDGWEIRNRTALMVENMSAFLSRTAQQEPTRNITVVSVAGGTALATMQAIMHSGVDPAKVELILLESSERSATMAFDLAGQIGFAGKISLEDMDVFSPAAMAELAARLEATGRKATALDAVGIAEYSSTRMRSRALVERYGEDYMLYNPEKFVEACLGLVEADGMAVVGQMRADRPNPYFTRGVVSWPYISMRTVKRFAEVMRDGGVDLSLAKFSLTPLGSYTMATLYKSEAAACLGGLQPRAEAASTPWPAWLRGIRARRAASSVGGVIMSEPA